MKRTGVGSIHCFKPQRMIDWACPITHYSIFILAGQLPVMISLYHTAAPFCPTDILSHESSRWWKGNVHSLWNSMISHIFTEEAYG